MIKFIRGPVVLAYIALLVALAIGLSAAVGYARDRDTDKVVANLRGYPITVYTYHPTGCSDPALLFVFHGLGRNASSYRNSARKLADKECMVVFAPLFDKERFPSWRYQRGGIVYDQKLLPREQWTTSLVVDLIAWARQTENMPNAPYYLFGHSAGAQFLSRVAAFQPLPDASRIVIANPSTYVLPSTKEPVPYGLGGMYDPVEGERRLKAYLELPLTIYLGEDDTGDEDLAQTSTAMRQGENRLERGELTFDSARSLAKAKGWDFRWRLVTAPGVGHTARGMLGSDNLMEVFDLKEPEVAQ
ncbi:alpha/beta hydrolase [Microvirga sp. 2YAF29]|uniref:alpha/beta hydrolase n=1 Tax=Microvirga sp. 2YAF29 TaxID=3233031 RepID=UPI003F9672F6